MSRKAATSMQEEGQGRAGEWRIMSLREAGVLLFDCEHRTPPAQEYGYPYVGIPQINDGRIDLDGVRYITREHFDEWTRKAKPEPFDIVLSRRCNPGETCFVAQGLEFALGQNLVLLRSDGTRIFKPFLRWLVRGPQWWEQVGRHLNVGALFDSLKCADIPGFQLSIPSLSEQRAIAHVLGTLDDKVELNRRMNETLESMARALFKSWFVDFDPVHAKAALQHSAASHDWTVARARAYLDGMEPEIAALFPDRFVASESGRMIPEGWEETTLNEIALLNPEAWTARNAPETIVYVDLSNTKWGTIEKYETHEWQDAPSRAKRVLRTGDTILGTVRPGNGSYAFIGRDGLTGSTGFAVLRPVLPQDRTLVWGYATAPENIRRLTHVADGAAYPAVRPQVVGATKITLPSDRTRDAFGRVCGPFLDRMEANQRESCALAALRDTLLPKLVSGRIRIPGAERQGSSGRGAGRQ